MTQTTNIIPFPAKMTDDDVRTIHRAMGVIMGAMTHDLSNREFYEDLNKKLIDITMKMWKP